MNAITLTAEIAAAVDAYEHRCGRPMTDAECRYVEREAERINECLAEGCSVHFQSSVVRPWLAIVRATPMGRRILFEFSNGSFELCPTFSASCGYTLGFNLRDAVREALG